MTYMWQKSLPMFCFFEVVSSHEKSVWEPFKTYQEVQVELCMNSFGYSAACQQTQLTNALLIMMLTPRQIGIGHACLPKTRLFFFLSADIFSGKRQQQQALKVHFQTFLCSLTSPMTDGRDDIVMCLEIKTVKGINIHRHLLCN